MRTAQSSHVQGYDYNESTETLTVQFTDGSMYQYHGVPPTEYWNMSQSNGMGAGSYFRAKIKGQYPTRKVGARPRRG